MVESIYGAKMTEIFTGMTPPCHIRPMDWYGGRYICHTASRDCFGRAKASRPARPVVRFRSTEFTQFRISVAIFFRKNITLGKAATAFNKHYCPYIITLSMQILLRKNLKVDQHLSTL